jgi:hypothetical protein
MVAYSHTAKSLPIRAIGKARFTPLMIAFQLSSVRILKRLQHVKIVNHPLIDITTAQMFPVTRLIYCARAAQKR